MYKNIEAVDAIVHKDVKVSFPKNFLYSKDLMDTIITLPEFYEACKDYPIVFIKNEEQWSSVCLLGYKQGENAFVNKKGEWDKLKYVPAFIRRYPFILAEQEQGLILALETSAKSEDGERLFKDDGTQSEFLEAVMKFLNEYYQGAQTTAAFVKDLESWGVLELQNATVTRPNGENFEINGFYIVSEDKLNKLDDKTKDEICKKGAVPFITAHLISLSNFKKLANA